ncbi:MAG TPA: hypothetical protein VFV19_10440 [Candidatus Polarisedimenticolaceae bacterium]|nr:hypothetical protein [Candidatus Polarisedimenticolaceae bacterium]
MNESALEIRSLDELRRHEPEILRRIAAVPNGGNLFLAHPFMLFSEIGVVVSSALRAELVRARPLFHVSVQAYRAIKRSPKGQRSVVAVNHLFADGRGNCHE